MERLYFTEEHVMLRDMVRDFAQNEVKPIAREIDANGTFPREAVTKMAELGLMGILEEKIWRYWHGYSRISHCY